MDPDFLALQYMDAADRQHVRQQEQAAYTRGSMPPGVGARQPAWYGRLFNTLAETLGATSELLGDSELRRCVNGAAENPWHFFSRFQAKIMYPCLVMQACTALHVEQLTCAAG
jgi:hypothetical protein